VYISNLKIHGFKSFGRKTSLDFGQGITGIVGPNGCGKTNIVDALRWVLGEQKQSVLRSARMDEIIFNGSRNHKPSGLCEVVLTIHNDKSKLPVEYTDIEIARRLYRDGESEYLINRNPCRLKDILDLFMDTGMGSDAYSVIELKMIEAILSEVGEDRRRMFEEAAGINKYKKQRTSTQRKLEATRQDLERVKDIIAEVESKVRSLGLQLKRFERHKKLTATLKELELTLAHIQVQGLSEQMAPLQEALGAGRESHDAEAALIAEDEDKLSSYRETLSVREMELETARTALADAVNQLNELKQQEVAWTEQQRATGQSLERFEQEREGETDRRQAYREEVKEIEVQLEAIGPELERMQLAFEARRLEEEAVNERFRAGEQKLQSAREARYSHQHLVQEEEARRRRTEEIIGEKTNERTRLEQTITDRKSGSATLDEQRKVLARNKQEREARLASLANELEDLNERLTHLDDEETSLREALHQAATQLEVLQSRLEIYTELAESHEGYPGGARDILAKKDQFAGLAGAVADLVDVDGAYALAVETALGPYATCLVTDTDEQARAILAYASENALGRLAVIPLNRLSDQQGAALAPVKEAPGIPLLQFIKVPERLSGLYQHLLADIYWSADPDPTNGAIPPGATVVTAAGHRFGDIPVLAHQGTQVSSNGEAEAPQGGATLVGRSAEVDRLKRALEDTNRSSDDLDRRLTETREQKNALAARRKELDGTTDEALSEMNRLNREINQLEYEQGRLTADIDELNRQLPTVGEMIQSLAASRAAHDKVLEDLNNRKSQLDTLIAEADESYRKVQEERDVWREELQELRVNQLNKENQRQNLAERKLSLEDALQASTERIAQLEQERTQARQTLDTLAIQLKKAAEQLRELEEQVAAKRQASAEKEAVARQTRDEISQLEERTRQRQRGREETLVRHRDLELKLVDLQREEELIRSRIREVYREEIPDRTEALDEYVTPEDLAAEIDRMRGSIERIGPINMAVADEYAEESGRFKFLTEQRNDLIQAEESLLETIQRIDQQARGQFRDTYDKIRHHFKQTFDMFFEGGEGNLRLVGDPDPLEANIDIIATPPGKNSRSLRSLSAGEKALTAIALLFAIYMVKPSPYCILDEVDAPLDDTNIAKFGKVIRQFAKETQFIIVTHNKLTMEQANYLYGVTMEEEGLSTLVSVDLEAYAN